MTDETLLLDAYDVAKSFGAVVALRSASLRVRPGEVHALMGANGAGKTTLFEAIAGNITPTSGDILLDGRSICGMRPDQTARCGVARTFQIVKPFSGLSVFENVQIAALFGTGGRTHELARSAAHEALEFAGLRDRAEVLAGDLTLSGQKRLEVARAVATGARLLLIDEVMAGLTPTEINQMIEILKSLRLKKQLTLIVIEHVMRALMEISDRIIVLHLGQCIARGTPTEIAADPKVSDIYFGAGAADA